MNRKELKSRAKSQLGGIFETNWIYAMLIGLIASVVTSAAGGIVAGIGAWIVIGPMSYAVAKMHLRLVRTGEKPDFNVLIDGFKDDFGGIFLIGLLTTLFVLLWSILFVIPGIVKSYEYSMVYYVKADHPDYDWHQCINESKRLTKGHKGELFVLDLSFIGWFIVGAICLGIGTFWVTAYQSQTKANFYNDLVAAELGNDSFNTYDSETTSTYTEFNQFNYQSENGQF